MTAKLLILNTTLILSFLVFTQNSWSYDNTARLPHTAQFGKKPSKAAQIKEYGTRCGLEEMDRFEKARGRLPTDDEMDLILDACVNPSSQKSS